MKHSRFVFLIVAILISPGILFAGIEDFKGELPNAVVLEDGVTGGGTPSEKAVQTAAAQNYKTIIDLRMPEEGSETEKSIVQKYGLEYINIPTSAENISKEQADKLNGVLSRENAKPVILHCASGNRAAAVWAIYRRFYAGDSPEAVLAEASAKGLKPNLKDKVAGIVSAE